MPRPLSRYFIQRICNLLSLAEMNREIASNANAPEKSEADFCARRAAALSRPRHGTVHTPPENLHKDKVYRVNAPVNIQTPVNAHFFFFFFFFF